VRYLLAIFIFGLLVAFHELAHVVAARLFGIRVERLVFGLGPAVFSLRRGRMEYALGAIPLGAHASIYGLHPHNEALELAGRASFAARAPWIRLIVLFSGSLANYLLALTLLVILHMMGTHVPVRMTIGTVEPASAAAQAGLRPGDVLTTVDGVEERVWSRLVDKVSDTAGTPVVLRVQRGDASLDVKVTPRPDARGEMRLGIGQQYVFRQHTRFGDALRVGVSHANAIIGEGLRLIFRLAQGKPAANPLLLLRQSSEAASSGLRGWLRLSVALSIALMAFNLLPFPSLDGGRMLLILVEMTTGRRLPPAREAWLHTGGFWLLMVGLLWLAFVNVKKVLPRRAAPSSPPVFETTETPPPPPTSPAGSATSDGGTNL
jgi:regulator of sigma E protease